MQSHAESALILLHHMLSGNRRLIRRSCKATKIRILLVLNMQVSKLTQKIRQLSCKTILQYKINRLIYGTDVSSIGGRIATSLIQFGQQTVRYYLKVSGKIFPNYASATTTALYYTRVLFEQYRVISPRQYQSKFQVIT